MTLSAAGPTTRRPAFAVAALLTVMLLAATPAAAATATRTCGNQTVELGHGSEGEAMAIRATRVSCTRARQVARACVHGRRSGWKVVTEPFTSHGIDRERTKMRRGDAIITFEIVGGGGCAS